MLAVKPAVNCRLPGQAPHSICHPPENAITAHQFLTSASDVLIFILLYIYAMSKLSRHSAIRDLVTDQDVPSQEELRRRLYKRGHRVTQATLSRDIHELGLVKTSEGYKLPQGEISEAFLPSIERLIHEFVYDVKTAQNQVVVKTSAGSAQPVSAAIDGEEWEEVVGTIGGDDTILVICPDHRTAEKLTGRIRGYFK